MKAHIQNKMWYYKTPDHPWQIPPQKQMQSSSANANIYKSTQIENKIHTTFALKQKKHENIK